jgi:two-component system, LytTR family, sensor kinase
MISRIVISLRRRPGAYWTLQVAGWSAFALVSVLTLLPSMPTAVIPRLLLTKFTRATIGLGASDLLRRLYASPQMHRLPSGLSVSVAAVAVTVLGMLWYVAFIVTANLWAPPGTPPIAWAAVPHGAMDSMVVLGAWSTAYFGIQAWRQSEASAREADNARARADRAQLDALRYQLNPHFLFNALSSMRALISEDQTAARAMVTKFAEMLRNSLDASSTGEVPLGDEIAAVRNYLEIERIRFEEALDVGFDIAPHAAPYLVPTLILNPLVENAIAHGCRGDVEPLRVRIRADVTAARLRIEVANTGTLSGASRLAGAPATPHSRFDGHHRAVGVTSVRERLALLYPGHHRFALEQDGSWVRATIEIDSTLRQG